MKRSAVFALVLSMFLPLNAEAIRPLRKLGLFPNFDARQDPGRAMEDALAQRSGRGIEELLAGPAVGHACAVPRHWRHTFR